ncbi:phospholipase [Lysobacter yananisis]|uniref:Phospholipase n=1 Tax=Lysobacter yananisis TaxID=1003114 RepID=A0ABY9P7Y2_9GAMM|nr:XVIPCD domain-containing protein [Lysobacter yananisis]WMT03094.1 phospholipase [Lysobacter yananisis]
MSQQTEPTAGAQPPQSFADQVRGTQAKPIDKTLSRLMDDLYDQGPGIDGFKPLDAEQLRAKGIDPATLENKDSGFLARIYGDEHGHYVLAYSGTDEGKDWLTNFRQGLGFEDAQYNQAMALAREAKVAFGDEVVITGHSLGGGLAAAASITSGIPAVTFNASGVHDKTLERIGIDADAAKQEMADSGQIRRYAVKNEILTDLQEHSIPLKWAMPDAVGHKIELPDPDPQSFWQKLIPGSGIKHGVDIHYIEAVIKAQEMATPGERGHDAGRAAAATGAREAGRDALADAAHPHNGMYQQALHGLRGLPPGALEFGGEQGLRNAATHAALDAGGQGMRNIDHIIAGRDGRGFFAVEGGLDDPSHRRVFLDQQRAVSEPQHTAAVQPQPEAAPAPQESKRAVMN